MFHLFFWLILQACTRTYNVQCSAVLKECFTKHWQSLCSRNLAYVKKLALTVCWVCFIYKSGLILNLCPCTDHLSCPPDSKHSNRIKSCRIAFFMVALRWLFIVCILKQNWEGKTTKCWLHFLMIQRSVSKCSLWFPIFFLFCASFFPKIRVLYWIIRYNNMVYDFCLHRARVSKRKFTKPTF